MCVQVEGFRKASHIYSQPVQTHFDKFNFDQINTTTGNIEVLIGID